MKTIRLTDEAFQEIAAALEDKANGQDVLIEVLTGRYGPESEHVKSEIETMVRLQAAALDFHGLSSWRSNGTRTMPAGSRFKTPGEKG